MDWLITAAVTAAIWAIFHLLGVAENEKRPHVEIEIEATVQEDCQQDQPEEPSSDCDERRNSPLDDAVLPSSGRLPDEKLRDNVQVAPRGETSAATLRPVYWLSYRSIENVGGAVRSRSAAPR